MDPNATAFIIARALPALDTTGLPVSDDTLDAAIAACYDLIEWIGNGGFEPTGKHRDMIEASAVRARARGVAPVAHLYAGENKLAVDVLCCLSALEALPEEKRVRS